MDRPENRPKLLVIDDDDQGRSLTVMILEEHGFSVSEADCGEQALSAVEVGLPDAVLLDAMMPGLDGFETCRKLRAIRGAEHLPILMLTGLTDDQSVVRAYEAGATDFFVKSTQWTLLAQRIRYLLRASRIRDELINSRAKEVWAQRIAHLGYWEWDVANSTFMASEECFQLVGCTTAPSSNAISMSVSEGAQFFEYIHAEDRGAGGEYRRRGPERRSLGSV